MPDIANALDAAVDGAQEGLRSQGIDPPVFIIHFIVSGEGGEDDFDYAVASRPVANSMSKRHRDMLRDSLRRSAAELEE